MFIFLSQIHAAVRHRPQTYRQSHEALFRTARTRTPRTGGVAPTESHLNFKESVWDYMKREKKLSHIRDPWKYTAAKPLEKLCAGECGRFTVSRRWVDAPNIDFS